MHPSEPTLRTDNGFCLGCGYALCKLEGCQCPECGRAFDPADPSTMSLGRPLQAWQRWLLRPFNRLTLALPIIGSAGLIYLGGWPRLYPEPPAVLLQEFRWPRPEMLPPTLPDVVFYASAVLWGAFIAWATVRQLARWLLVPRAARAANVWQIDTRPRRRAMGAAAILSFIFLIFGWQERVGRRWIVRMMAPLPSPAWPGYDPRHDPRRHSPVKLSPAEAEAALRNLIVDLPTSEERLTALAMLTDGAGHAALPSFVHAAKTESDESLLAWELRLIGLCRDPQTADLLISYLKDPRPIVRAAAADAIGILRHPSYSIYVPDGFWICEPLAMDTQPPIYVGGLASPGPSENFRTFNGGRREHDLISDSPMAVDPSVRKTLEEIMLGGATQDEREAAARTLVDWPPDHYKLRLAEWGVWISYGQQMTLAQSVLEEIPPFVYRTGNPTSSFEHYFLYPSAVTKPIVHLSASVPLAVDVEAQIRQGRPWFAYPMPDDFAIGGENVPYKVIGTAGGFPFPRSSTTTTPDDFNAPPIPSLPNCREGYPWLIPHHRVRQSQGTTFGGPALIASLGLRWQSAIVSPKRLNWMTVPVVPSDPKFDWWGRLRKVPSSWIASRGETERFLYYDGPTQATVPLAARLNRAAGRIDIDLPREPHFGYGTRPQLEPQFEPLAAISPPGLPQYEGLYIELHSGRLRALSAEIKGDGGSLPLVFDPTLTSEATVAGRLRGMLLHYGLSGPEAEGLIAAWAPQFFRAEGRRFILRMSPDGYAKLCPMQVRPAPTEVVRLGLILTEFDPQPATTSKAVR